MYELLSLIRDSLGRVSGREFSSVQGSIDARIKTNPLFTEALQLLESWLHSWIALYPKLSNIGYFLSVCSQRSPICIWHALLSLMCSVQFLVSAHIYAQMPFPYMGYNIAIIYPAYWFYDLTSWCLGSIVLKFWKTKLKLFLIKKKNLRLTLL